VTAILLSGCSIDSVGLAPDPMGDGGDDTSAGDTSVAQDSAPPDSVSPDVATPDSSPPDTTVVDSGAIDTGDVDTGLVDTGAIDTGLIDTGAIDTGVVDTGLIDKDTGLVDTGVVDTGTPDTAPPCAFPTIGSTVSGSGITISAVSLAGGGNTITVKGTTSVSLSLNYSIVDKACSGCIDQIEIGLVPGSRIYCAYDANPPGSGSSGTSTHAITAPKAPGMYYVRYALAQNYGCTYNGASNWYGGKEPGDAQTIAAICVVP
jgi:hypothetical protein